MDHEEVGRFWNANADAWTKLARAGYDVYRDFLNTPAFLAMLPEVNGLSGLDIGCGEGHNTRLLAQRRVLVTAIDIPEVFIAHAKQAKEQEPLGIDYKINPLIRQLNENVGGGRCGQILQQILSALRLTFSWRSAVMTIRTINNHSGGRSRSRLFFERV